MIKLITVGVVAAAIAATSFTALAQKNAEGSVVEYSGIPGELIVSRDGIVYYLSTGEDLFNGDILRSKEGDVATITYRGCTYDLPSNEDVALDDEFCALIVAEEPTMAMAASGGAESIGLNLGAVVNSANAPLMVGGVVLSAGGLAAATGGDGGGAGSATSAAAGNPGANSTSP